MTFFLYHYSLNFFSSFYIYFSSFDKHFSKMVHFGSAPFNMCLIPPLLSFPKTD